MDCCLSGCGSCSVDTSSSSIGHSVIDARGARTSAIFLLKRRCFLDLRMGFVTGGRVGGLVGWQSAAVDGDQRTGRDELAPGVMGNSKCSDACTVWEKVG